MSQKCAIFCVLLLIGGFVQYASASAAAPQENERDWEEGRHYFINLSLYYPISINRSKHDSANINLSLIYGHVGCRGAYVNDCNSLLIQTVLGDVD